MDVGAALGKGSFWDSYVKDFSKLTIDNGATLEDARFFARWVQIFRKSDEVFDAVSQDCLFGTLTVLLAALPAVDYEHGREEAISCITVARALVSAASSQPDEFLEARTLASASGWKVEAILSTLQTYEMALGLAPLRPSGPCQGPKIFVYPSPPVVGGAAAKSLQTGPQHYLQALAQAPLQCLFGMYGTELLFHRRLLEEAQACSTDAEEAELFFVPSYFKCIEVLNYFDGFDSSGAEATRLLEQTLDHIRSFGPFFDRLDGADHVVLFSWGRFPCRLPGWRSELRSAIFLQVEDRCQDLNTEGPSVSFNRWKDVMIPGHIDKWRALELRSKNLPFEARDVLISFHGRHSGNAESYGNVTVRTTIMSDLSGLPGVSVGGFIEDYHKLLGSSRFCLAPRGITPWTIHLFVAMLAGCIPVILSDDLEAPFQELVDWTQFSIKWPMEAAGNELYNYLVAIPADQLQELKRMVDKHACWFDYYSEDESCNPFLAVLEMLKKRAGQKPRFAGKFWGPRLSSWGPRSMRRHSLSPAPTLLGFSNGPRF